MELDQRPSTLREYLDLLWRRRWVVLAAMVTVPLVATLFAMQKPSRYQASSAVLVDSQNLAATLEGIPVAPNDPARFLTTQVELARVPEVARRTLEATGIKRWTPQQFLDTSSVSAGQDSDLLTFYVTNGNPALAASLATAYAHQFVKYRLELDTQALRGAEASVAKRMQKLKAASGEKSALYANLAAKSEQLATLESLQTARAVFVRAAGGATKVQPNPKKDALFGVVLGLLLGLGVVALLEALDSRVRSSETVAGRLGLRLLARIPQHPAGQDNGDGLVMIGDSDGPEAEAYRILRSNLEWTNTGDEARSILVTSALAKEGKSTTVANLAVALARGGRRVALIDLDLRSPMLHRFFGLKQVPGLTDVVLRGLSIDRVVAPADTKPVPQLDDNVMRGRWGNPSSSRSAADPAGTRLWGDPPSDRTDASDAGTRLSEGRLEVLTAGTLPAHPGEFVSQLQVGPILDYLKSRNDIVLIDGPPLLAVGDAISLSSDVDALLVVAHLATMRTGTLDDLDRALRDCPAPALGLVVVGVPAEAGYGYPSYPRQRRKAVA